MSDAAEVRLDAAGGTLGDALFRALKREIVENALPAQTILTEPEVARRFGVSRAPARDALRRLTGTGFARARSRVGYEVTSVGLVDLDEVFAVRLALEPVSTELAVPRLTSQDLERLSELAAGTGRVVGRPAAERAARTAKLNADFHREVARISGNRHILRIVGALIDELERVMHLLAYSPLVETVVDEHPRLVEVMRAGDGPGAARLMRAQLLHDYQVMREVALAAGGLELRP